MLPPIVGCQLIFCCCVVDILSAIDLLRERATDDDLQHLNTVLVNYARVLW